MNLIIHHWDADGICSAAIVAAVLEEEGEDWVNVSLMPGIFEFDERIWKMADDAEKVFVVDLNMPESVERLQSRVFYLDHHPQKRLDRENIQHINPVVYGNQGAPSASWVVSQHFGRWSHLSALGAVGDLGQRAFEIAEVARLLEELGKERALRLAALVDSPSVLGDRRGVEDAVEKLKDTHPSELLHDAEWNENLEKAEMEIGRVIDGVELKNGIACVEFSSNLNIISKVARKLVWELDYNAAFALNRDYHGFSQLYLRVKPGLAENFRIPELIDKLKKSGVNAGGKKDVAGIICKIESLGRVVEIVEGHLEVCTSKVEK